MARREIEIDGDRWYVYPSGRVTTYERDEFGVVFEKGTGPARTRRVTRYSPLGARRWDVALLELSDVQLVELFRQSQPSETRTQRCEPTWSTHWQRLEIPGQLNRYVPHCKTRMTMSEGGQRGRCSRCWKKRKTPHGNNLSLCCRICPLS